MSSTVIKSTSCDDCRNMFLICTIIFKHLALRLQCLLPRGFSHSTQPSSLCHLPAASLMLFY